MFVTTLNREICGKPQGVLLFSGVNKAGGKFNSGFSSKKVVVWLQP